MAEANDDPGGLHSGTADGGARHDGNEASSNANNSSRRNRGGRRNHRGNNPGQKGNQGRFIGATPEIKHHVYDLSNDHTNFETFEKTTREIANYVGRTCQDGGDFRNGMLALELPPLPAPRYIPPTGDNVTEDDRMAAQAMWQIQLKKWDRRMYTREMNQQTVFAIILGQCSQAMVDLLQSEPTWTVINSSHDTIGLLKLIRGARVTQKLTSDPMCSVIYAEHDFYHFRQRDLSVSEYYNKFKDLITTLEQLGGDVGGYDKFIVQVMDELDLEGEDGTVEAERVCRQRYHARLFILKSDKRRFGNLVADLENSYTRGVKQWPDTLTKAREMLQKYRPITNVSTSSEDETGLTFLNKEKAGNTSANSEDNPKTDAGMQRAGRGRGRGGGGRNQQHDAGRGRGAGRNSGGHDDAKNAQFLMTANWDNLDIDNEDYSFVQQVEIHHTFGQHTYKLPKSWLLLDTCSTVDMFYDKSLLHNIHKVSHGMTVHTNGGTTRTDMQGYFSDYPEPVWYHPKAIANILSYHNVSRHYRITTDTAADSAFNLHTRNGDIIQFTPTKHGLYKADMNNTHWTLVTTVKDQQSLFSKRQTDNARLARQIQNIINYPSTKAYRDMVRDRFFPDMPITQADIDTAEIIYGPNIGALKGKTVHHHPRHLQTGIDGIPADIKQAYSQGVTLTADLMYINGIAFLITVSRGLYFGTVQCLDNRQVPTIAAALKVVLDTYRKRGFAPNPHYFGRPGICSCGC